MTTFCIETRKTVEERRFGAAFLVAVIEEAASAGNRSADQTIGIDRVPATAKAAYKRVTISLG